MRDERLLTPTDEPSIEARRLDEAAALTEACETLSPYARDRFTKSFDSFEEYAAWKNAQANPWDR